MSLTAIAYETVIKEKAAEPEVRQQAQPQPQAKNQVQAKKKMTPLYSIVVTNELFHNGNVEAWKRIITSYTAKYTDLDVYIFYEGERINDINTLFKWGKVKFGTQILIRIMGKEFTDASKLRRYLHQGASPKFEAFLKGAPGQILSLF